ncbi:hemerythrin domain-containing protein [Rhodococcus sp. T7]|uniref:hemerythrin domain-containing protein n=1 Tax=Rhodococcus sp. T7 TaxID=627444 RepID=UPI00135B37AB|nr:hemerythrin domain-containing protein [Rhodococcus sp. T7]KAF0957368.1 hypothetical protein MLGJGCBP_09200 [Rhodococcus sp. T7]KAF0962161.1 hypothetical protein MLGJGCBP_04782 [Rhodococcus sp. T7]
MTEQRDVIEVLTHDHRKVERMFAELEGLDVSGSAGAPARKKDLVDQITIELVRHAAAEEAALYPAVKIELGELEAERATHGHARAEEMMQRLEPLAPTNSRFDTELATLMREIRGHVAEEEGVLFPRMRMVFTAGELLELGRKVESVKKLAPTRPHPFAADEPPAATLLGPIAGLLDRLRDAITRRGTER